MKIFYIYIKALCLLCSLFFVNDVFSANWYEGGNLHQASVKAWRESSYSNRLATAADWFVSITKEHNPKLKKQMDSLSAYKYLSALKKHAVRLEKCVSETASLKSENGVVFKADDKIAEVASLCYILMYVQ